MSGAWEPASLSPFLAAGEYIGQLPASPFVPHPNHGVVWHRWCVYTPHDRVFTDRQFRGRGCSRHGYFSLEFLTGVYGFFVIACWEQGGTVQVRGTGLQYKQNLG